MAPPTEQPNGQEPAEKMSKSARRKARRHQQSEQSTDAPDAATALKTADPIMQSIKEKFGLQAEAEVGKSHEFWDAQPMPKMVDAPRDGENAPIHGPLKETELRHEPFPLPDGYEWCEVDIEDDDEMEEVYQLLYSQYVTDDDGMFRFAYPKDILRFALLTPGHLKEWHIGVRGAPIDPTKKKNKDAVAKAIEEGKTEDGLPDNGKADDGDDDGDGDGDDSKKPLVAFITGTLSKVRVYSQVLTVPEINFLCLVDTLRSKKFAPLLIKEITRRVHLKGIFQAVYTAGVLLPRPVTTATYYHRSLNYQKLVDVQFSPPPRGAVTMDLKLRALALPAEVATPGLRPMQHKDAGEVVGLFKRYGKKFNLAPVFNEAEVLHMFLPPQENVIYSYVVANPDTGRITDVLSFYSLPSSVLRHSEHDTINVAYQWYTVAEATPRQQLMRDALILAKQENFDVFNALNIADNEKHFEELQFGKGDGDLHYYVFNWRCPSMTPDKMALIMM